MDKSLLIKLIIIIIYFSLIILTELIYHNSLFEKSLDIIQKFQEKFNKTSFLYTFFNFWTNLGSKGFLIVLYLITFFFIPLNKVYILIFLLVYTSFINGLFQIIYMQERPIWRNYSLKISSHFECIYGNPSGHSLGSSCSYLALWYIITDINFFKSKKNTYFKYIILFFTIIIFLLIMLSRLYLGVHGLNQIIFGFLIGLGLFLVFLPLIKVHSNNGVEFLNNHYNYRIQITLFFIFNIIIFYCFYILREDNNDIEKNEGWKLECDKKKWFKKLIRGSFIGGMSIFALIGMFFGILYCGIKIKKNYNDKENIFINWNEGFLKGRIIRFLFIIIGAIPAGIAILFLYCFNWNYIFHYIFTPIAFSCSGFLIFGPCLFYGFRFINNKFGKQGNDNNQNVSMVLENDQENST